MTPLVGLAMASGSDSALGQAQSMWPALVKTLGGLCIIIGLMFLLSVVLRRMRFGGVGKGQGRIQIKESRALGNKRMLCLVEVRGQEVLLGVTPERIETLCELGAVPEDAGFDDLLRHQSSKKS